ncbi:MAG: HAD-IB family hydrolase [Gammaproteobacteria bacterium]|nr:MAG: HAD-IB family hydrolase [Gammaproteobacteria bacterium]
MTLAIFDLDNTLLNGDSDHAWGEFLIQEGIVDEVTYKTANDEFYEDYKRGELDIFAYLEFALEPLTHFDMDELSRLHEKFMADFISSMMLPKAKALLDQHRDQGHFLLIITATNLFVTEPIGRALHIDDMLATNPEIKDNRYTGKVAGTPCYQHGKVARLETWLKDNDRTLEDSYFYSDSINDLPLLERVTHPVAVDPCDSLQTVAQKNNWPIISLRD